MAKNKQLQVKGVDVAILTGQNTDFISLTDLARYKDDRHKDDIIKNWLRNRNTIEMLGLWETLNNPDFKPVEFDGFNEIKAI
ncbi:MAG: KilA-N domain-containing protein [Bacteroidales bacterium]|nr:KilA-N domain-containing protein [Bacteroidales bacterium]MCF8338129.1 KilA-N domain-containing protein [Bacteroidales bacterium]